MACRTGCVTKDHQSYAACLRAGAPRIAYANSAGGWDYTQQKKWDADLAAYRSARAEGIQPSGTSRAQVTAAVALSDAKGKAWDAS